MAMMRPLTRICATSSYQPCVAAIRIISCQRAVVQPSIPSRNNRSLATSDSTRATTGTPSASSSSPGWDASHTASVIHHDMGNNPNGVAPVNLTMRSEFHGRRIIKELGVVEASSFRRKNILVDLFTAIFGVFGGESLQYSQLINECNRESAQRLLKVAQDIGATSVVNFRFTDLAVQSRMVLGLHVGAKCAGSAVIDVPIDDTPSSTPAPAVAHQPASPSPSATR